MHASTPARQQTPWGALFWAVPILYIFLDPYRRGAEWMEWLLTGVVFATFVALYLAGMTHWASVSILRKICAAVLLLAVAFMAYRPSGAIFFALVAAFAPFTVGGRMPASAALIAGVLVVFGLEWWLIDFGRPTGVFPYIIAAEMLLVSAGTTFVARNNRVVERFHRVTERERIARDLHDVLGHALSSITLKAELARRLFDVKPARALAEIADVERISRQTLDEVREAIQGYHAGDIYSELERTTSMLQAAGIEVEQRCERLDLDAARERVLALVLREAATNVVRHAQAQHCRLALTQERGDFCLEVRDDGRGEIRNEGIGMRSIRSRAEALGGRATWTTESGTRLVVTLPHIADAAAASMND